MRKSPWPNTALAAGPLADEIQELKMQNGKDLIVYGGSSFVSSLIKEGLIDDYHFFVNPVALGKGEPIFNKLNNWKKLKLKRCIPYPSGIVMLNYESL
jgi:dihydrofolate reductase